MRTPVPFLTGYVSWCDSCGWNVFAQAAEPPKGALAKLYASAGKRFGDRLAMQLIEAKSLEPRLTIGLFAAYALAVIVLGATVALVVGGVLLAVLPFPNVFAIMIGVAIAFVGVEMRPRLGKVPDENVLTRAEAPKLFALVDEIAEASARSRRTWSSSTTSSTPRGGSSASGVAACSRSACRCSSRSSRRSRSR